MTNIIQAYNDGKEIGQRIGAAGVWGEVNKFLRKECGIEHPKGMKGLRDLKQQREGAHQALEDYKEVIAERVHDELEHFKEWMQSHQGAGPFIVSRKLKEIEHYIKEGR